MVVILGFETDLAAMKKCRCDELEEKVDRLQAELTESKAREARFREDMELRMSQLEGAGAPASTFPPKASQRTKKRGSMRAEFDDVDGEEETTPSKAKCILPMMHFLGKLITATRPRFSRHGPPMGWYWSGRVFEGAGGGRGGR